MFGKSSNEIQSLLSEISRSHKEISIYSAISEATASLPLDLHFRGAEPLDIDAIAEALAWGRV